MRINPPVRALSVRHNNSEVFTSVLIFWCKSCSSLTRPARHQPPLKLTIWSRRSHSACACGPPGATGSDGWRIRETVNGAAEKERPMKQRRNVSMSASTKVIFRIGNKPLRFKGVLLGESSICDEDDTGCYTRVRLFKSEGGSLIWAWDLSESDEPTDEELMRADALVVDVNAIYNFSGPEDLNGDVARRSATPSELAHMAWEKRP